MVKEASCSVPQPGVVVQLMLESDVNRAAAQLETPTKAARKEDKNAKFLPKNVKAI
jgi:hypothetical protein